MWERLWRAFEELIEVPFLVDHVRHRRCFKSISHDKDLHQCLLVPTLQRSESSSLSLELFEITVIASPLHYRTPKEIVFILWSPCYCFSVVFWGMVSWLFSHVVAVLLCALWSLTDSSHHCILICSFHDSLHSFVLLLTEWLLGCTELPPLLSNSVLQPKIANILSKSFIYNT